MAEKTQWLGWVQFAIYLSLLLISVGVTYGAIQSRLSTVETRIDELKTDHDLIVAMSQKVNSMEQTLAEIKTDLREINRDMKRGMDRHILGDNNGLSYSSKNHLLDPSNL